MQSSKELMIKAKEIVDKHYENGNQKRLIHIYGVAEMASLLAERYNIDKYKAMAAGYMHDYSKYDNFDELKNMLTKEEIEECDKYPFLYHAYLSAEFFKKLISDDLDIYNAIKNHVFGRPKMSKLEAIIMIADYTEKNRTYPDCIRVREILLNGDFNLAIVESLKSTISHCQEKGDIPHPRQLEVLKEYQEKVDRGEKF